MGSGKGHQVASPATQMMAMLRAFPTMHLIDRGHLVWRGPIQPTEGGVIYTLEVIGRGKNGRPTVWVRSPSLERKPGSRVPPHCFPDGSLCLYHHKENPWFPDMLIAETIMPWACGWLLFYEFWLDTGAWLGPEYDHAGEKVA